MSDVQNYCERGKRRKTPTPPPPKLGQFLGYKPTVCSTLLYLLVLKVFKTWALKLENDLQMNAVAVVKI